MDNIKIFNIRVYALICNNKNEILLSDEFRLNRLMTKFPGGGLEFGEGTIDCLKREIREELGQEIEVISHFYTTDFFQKAIHRDDQQIISIYYLARFCSKPEFQSSMKKFDFEEAFDGAQSFRWEKISELQEKDLSLPIDKKVLVMMKEKWI